MAHTLTTDLKRLQELIYENTVRDRNRRNTIFVGLGSPLYEAIERGEMRAFGIEPGSGVLVDAGIDPATGKSSGGLLRLDTPDPPSAVDQLADLERT